MRPAAPMLIHASAKERCAITGIIVPATAIPVPTPVKMIPLALACLSIGVRARMVGTAVTIKNPPATPARERHRKNQPYPNGLAQQEKTPCDNKHGGSNGDGRPNPPDSVTGYRRSNHIAASVVAAR